MRTNASLPSRVGVALSIIVGIVVASGCARPSADEGPLSSTAPSVSTPSQPGATLLGKPTGSYDATGFWFAYITLLDGTHIGEGTARFEQDANGNITAFDPSDPSDPEHDPGTYVFTRDGVAEKKTIHYNFSLTSPDPDGSDPTFCGRDLRGTAVLDTTTNVVEVRRASGVIDDCSKVTLKFVFTKVS